MRKNHIDTVIDPIQLEVFKHLFSAIAEEMGVVLQKSSFSPNIKERRDFSCAIFNANGSMVAQAAHIPVHLGSMPLSVTSAIAKYRQGNAPLVPGDTIILNNPYLGGTHLPDITLVTPVFISDSHNHIQPELAKNLSDRSITPFAYVASRAHHSDVGGISPGSMPIAREIYQEGLIIPPVKIINGGVLNTDILDLILSNVRTPEERLGDLQAQIGANKRGVNLLINLINRYSRGEVDHFMQELLNYTERMTRALLSDLPNGCFSFEDYLDNNGISEDLIPIKVTITINNDTATVDFTGSSVQQEGNVNAVYAITLSAVNYVFRSLLDLDIPNNSGCLTPIHTIAPRGTVVNAVHPAPVAAGNVETSQRIVDVLLGALAQACPEKIPAASQGTMNNVSIGGWDPEHECYFTYYETIGGGTGASVKSNGVSAIHSHMTNTLNTPIEALEYCFPMQINRYEIRKNSGGKGVKHGGDGIIREFKFLTDAQITIISERRSIAPYGLAGGDNGQKGENLLIRGSEESNLPGKGSLRVSSGDILRISTPGGGGYGIFDERE